MTDPQQITVGARVRILEENPEFEGPLNQENWDAIKGREGVIVDDVGTSAENMADLLFGIPSEEELIFVKVDGDLPDDLAVLAEGIPLTSAQVELVA